MAVSCKVGRPYHVAVIDFKHDPDQELYDQFYAACRGLSHYEMVILSRALGVQVRTIENWKYGKTFPPKRGMAVLVISWVDAGKPEATITQAEAAAAANMFQGG